MMETLALQANRQATRLWLIGSKRFWVFWGHTPSIYQ